MTPHALPRVVLCAAALALGACSNYVKRTEFDAAISDLDRRVSANEAALAALRSDLESRLDAHEARFEELAGRLYVDMNVHFAFDSATVRPQDQPTLDDFAAVLREHHSQAAVTVEGFSDPAGSPGYNRALAQRRADGVRAFLVGPGGLDDARVRSVSYGEASERQLAPGAWGEEGAANRRVTLVVDLPPAAG
jgi:peptidoglycan-associated lipoprotein